MAACRRGSRSRNLTAPAGVIIGVIIVWLGVVEPVGGSNGVMEGDVSHLLPCIERLASCQDQVDKETVSASCCDPMKDLLREASKCVCAMFYNDDLMANFNLTRLQAMRMVVKCKAGASPAYCDKYINSTQRAYAESPLVVETLARAGALAPTQGSASAKAGPQNGLVASMLAMMVISKMTF